MNEVYGTISAENIQRETVQVSALPRSECRDFDDRN
jgi:hypothetical protein